MASFDDFDPDKAVLVSEEVDSFDPNQAVLLEPLEDDGFDPANAVLVETEEPPLGQMAPAPIRPPARESLAKALQDAKLFGSATTALGGAADKGIRRREDGNWDLPALTTNDGGFLDSAAGMITSLAQKTGQRIQDSGPFFDEQPIQNVFHKFQQDNNLSDEEVQAAWSDLGNIHRPWDNKEPARVLSDGTLLPNLQNSEWLDDAKAQQIIDSSAASPQSKEVAKMKLEDIQSTIATNKMEAYTAASAVSPMQSPVEWSRANGRRGDFGDPSFIKDYERDVVSKQGWVSGLAADVSQGNMQMASQLAGLAGILGSEEMGKVGAEMSAASSQVGRGAFDTGIVGSVIEQAPSIFTQIALTRGLGAAATGLGATANTTKLVGTLGAIATAGGQSAGATYSSQIAAGDTPEQARDKAVKSGLNTAIITGIFQGLGAGGVEKVAAGKTVGQATVRDLINSATREELLANTKAFAANVVKSVAGEAAEEGIDEISQAFLTADPDTNLADAWDNAIKAAQIGGFIGGTVDIVAGVLERPEMKQATELIEQAAPSAPASAEAAAAAQQQAVVEDVASIKAESTSPKKPFTAEDIPETTDKPTPQTPVTQEEEASTIQSGVERTGVPGVPPINQTEGGEISGSDEVSAVASDTGTSPNLEGQALVDETADEGPTALAGMGPSTITNEQNQQGQSEIQSEVPPQMQVPKMPVGQETLADFEPVGGDAAILEPTQAQAEASIAPFIEGPLTPTTNEQDTQRPPGPETTQETPQPAPAEAVSSGGLGDGGIGFSPPQAAQAALTPEADQLLTSLEGGGIPMSVTPNLERIAQENGIDVTGTTRPQEIVDQLRARKIDAGILVSEGTASLPTDTSISGDITTEGAPPQSQQISASLPSDYSPEALATTFNLTPEQTVATDALVRSMGLDTSAIKLQRGADGNPQIQRSGQNLKGSMEILANGDALVRGLKNPDVSTGIHEITHVARRQLFDRSIPEENRVGLTDNDIAVAEDWAGAVDGVWTVAAEEKFARGFEAYLREGKAPNQSMAVVFSKISDWLKGIYATIKGSPLDVGLTESMREVFDKLVTRDVIEVLADTSPDPLIPDPIPFEMVEPEDETTGVKRTKLQELVDRYPNMDPLTKAAIISDIDAMSTAVATEEEFSKENPGKTAGTQLLIEIIENPDRTVTKNEVALLLHEIVVRKKILDNAIRKTNSLSESSDSDARATAVKEEEIAQANLNSAVANTRAVGSKAGQALQSFKMIAKDDFSLATVLNRAESSLNRHNGKQKKLTETERREFIDMAEKLQQAQARVAALEGDVSEQNELIEKLTADVVKAQKTAAARDAKGKSRIKAKLDPQVAAARARLEEQGVSFLAQANTLEPAVLKDLGIVGAGWLTDRALDLKDFTTKLVDTFGSWVSEHAEAIFKSATQTYNETAASVSGDSAPTPAEVKASLDSNQPLTKKDVWDMARAHVIAGLRGDAVLDAAHADLSEIYSNLTRDEVATLFTDYGKTTAYMGREASSSELTRIRSLEKMGLKIRDLKAGKLPAKSTRAERDSEIKTKEAEFRKLLKEYGVEETQDPQQALQQRKAAVTRSIERLQAIRESGIKDIQARRPVNPDAELNAMMEVRDALAAEVAEMRRVSPQIIERTEKRQLEAALKISEKALARIKGKLARNDLSVPVRTPTAASRNAAVQVLRSEIKEANAELDRRRREAKVGPYSDEARINRTLASIAKRRTELERRLVENDISKKTRAEPLSSQAVIDAEYELDLLKAKYEEMRGKLAMRNAPPLKKVGQATIQFSNLLKSLKLGLDFGVALRNLSGATFNAAFRDLKTLAQMKLSSGKAGQDARSRYEREGTILGSALKSALGAFKDAKSEFETYRSIRQDPRIKDHGKVVYLAPIDSSILQKEDIPRSNVIEDIPWWAWPALGALKWAVFGMSPPVGIAVIAASALTKPLLIALDRAQRTMTNVMRFRMMNAGIEAIAPDGNLTPGDRDALAAMVNMTTGRGATNNAKLEAAIPVANMGLLSTRYYISRIQILTLYPLWAKPNGPVSSAARKEFVKMYGRSLSVRAFIYASTAVAFGIKWDDEEKDEAKREGMNFNPFSSNFGKLSIKSDKGEVVGVDYMSGMNSFVVIAARMVFRKKTDAKGKTVDLEGSGYNNISDEFIRFLAGKRNTALAYVWDTAVKQEYFGKEEVTLKTALDQATTAVIVSDTKKIFETLGPVEGAAFWSLMFTGAGTRVLDNEATVKRKKEAREKAARIKARAERLAKMKNP